MPFDEPEARAHVIRLRDVLNSTSVALQGRLDYEPTPYDPMALVVDAGLSIFTTLRNSVNCTEHHRDEVDEALPFEPNGEVVDGELT